MSRLEGLRWPKNRIFSVFWVFSLGVFVFYWLMLSFYRFWSILAVFRGRVGAWIFGGRRGGVGGFFWKKRGAVGIRGRRQGVLLLGALLSQALWAGAPSGRRTRCVGHARTDQTLSDGAADFKALAGRHAAAPRC